MATKQFSNNLERCKHFYENYGTFMIRDRFQEYESRIAVGMVGEGSDCFGYDDSISKDHDYGIGFCMWVSQDTFSEIGKELENAYEVLVTEYAKEYMPQDQAGEISANQYINKRRGVITIDGFYQQLLGYGGKFESPDFIMDNRLWLTIPEENLAAAVNGEVFRDDEGLFSSVRNQIGSYYPEPMRRLHLANQIHQFSQNGQYNYPRMMARKDMLTARLCVAQAIKSAMAAAYLLNRRYAPYYKWMRRGLDEMPLLNGLGALLDQAALVESQNDAWPDNSYSSITVNMNDKVCALMEEIAYMLLQELRSQQLVKSKDLFLDLHCGEIAGVHSI